jgi:L-iditol 2-dehydrogenase
MRIARLHGPADLRLHDEERPRPGPAEVLVRVGAVGVCGSDIHWFTEGRIDENRIGRPFVPGHELGGRLEDGRCVAIDPAIPCGACRPCADGHPNLCQAIRFAGDGKHDGGLGEWLAWPERCIIPLPPPLNEADGAMLEPLGVAIHAVDLGHVPVGGSVAVFGCGPIGLLILAVARLVAGRLFATDLASVPHRLDAARALGAEVLPADGAEGRAIREACGRDGGVDVAFEAAGVQATTDAAIDAARPGGRVVIAGIPSETRTSFVAGIARRKGLTIALSRRMGEVYPRAIALVASGRVDVRSLVTHRFPLADVDEAFAAAIRRAGHKVIVEP